MSGRKVWCKARFSVSSHRYIETIKGKTVTEEQREFVAALLAYVRVALASADEAADYCREAVRVVDARNHLFCPAGRCTTDEAENIYALRDLCRLDEDTLELVPDEGRAGSISRNFF